MLYRWKARGLTHGSPWSYGLLLDMRLMTLPCEMMCVKESNSNYQMEHFEKCLRKGYGNSELCHATCDVLSLFRIGSLRCEWLRHEIRMSLMMAKRIFESKSGGKRKAGRSRLRCLEHVENDL
jgi:hypothetical protein